MPGLSAAGGGSPPLDPLVAVEPPVVAPLPGEPLGGSNVAT